MTAILSANKKELGQFFTVNPTIQNLMTSLILNQTKPGKTILEPSCGAGDLLNAAQTTYPQSYVTGWEIDDTIATNQPATSIIHGDFFALADSTIKNNTKYDTILGNPPYVAWKNVPQTTRTVAEKIKANYSDKTNLYHLFIDRSIDLLAEDGEIVFIVPKEWMYSTSAATLRHKILSTGKITHIVDVGEEKVFPDADVPAIIIFRYQKTRATNTGSKILYLNDYRSSVWENKKSVVTPSGYWLILDEQQADQITGWGDSKLGDYFDVKVGIITGADPIYNLTYRDDLQKFVDEGTAVPYVTTKGVEHYLDVNNVTNFNNIPPYTRNYLLTHKDALLSRKIFRFNETNWWKHGAIRNKPLMETCTERIYVYVKTRSATPFFTISENVTYFGGSIMALFPKNLEHYDEQQALTYLNSEMFRSLCKSLGLTTGNKVVYQPKTLAEVPYPPM